MKTTAALVLACSSVAALTTSSLPRPQTGLFLSREEILSSPDTIEMGRIWDPLGLSEIASDETIAWYRHSEIKHGRVAMAAFVGWWAVASGIHFPGELSYGLEFGSLPTKGLEAWEAVPVWGKMQMFLFAGIIEFYDELFASTRDKHYMRGGTPGKVNEYLVSFDFALSELFSYSFC